MKTTAKRLIHLSLLGVAVCLISNNAVAATPRPRSVILTVSTRPNVMQTRFKIGRTKVACYLGPLFSRQAFAGSLIKRGRKQLIEELARGKARSVQARRYQTYSNYCQALAAQRDAALAPPLSTSQTQSSSSSSPGELIGGSSSADSSNDASSSSSSSTSVAPPACSDGIDNDGDGLIDAPLDAGCANRNDDSEAGEELARKPLYVYSWDAVPAAATHILPWKWVASSRVDLAASTATAVNAMPQGHRILSFWDFSYPLPNGAAFTNDPSDYSTDPQTGRPYQALWWDNGVGGLSQQVSQFLSAYKRAGGNLDYLVIDHEEFYFGAWGLFQCDNPPLYRIPCAEVENRLRAIENDPRYLNDILPQLRSRGFPSSGSLSDILRNRTPWNTTGDPVLIWDAVMNARVAEYYNRAFVAPTVAEFPQAKVSNYLWNVQPQQFQLPDPNGNRRYLYEEGSLVGTHQAPSLYGYINYLRLYRLDGVNLYESTPFNAFRYDLNIMRTNVLSQVGRGVSPWIAFRSFGNLLQNNDLYQELVIHLHLSGAEQILLWNPGLNHSPPTPDADEMIVEAATREAEGLIGFADRQPDNSGLSWWGDEYLQTCSRVQNRRVCRVTPKPEYGAILQLVQQSDSGVQILLGGQTLTYPGAIAYLPTGTASPLGVWLVTPLTAP